MLTRIYDKIAKLPSWTGAVAVIAAAVVANIPFMLRFDVIWESMIAEYVNAGFNVENMLSNLPDGYKYVVALLSSLITWGIVELIAYFVLTGVLRGPAPVRNRQYYYNAVRFTYAVYKLIVGLYSLTAVYAPAAYEYAYSWLDFILITTLFTFCYFGIKEKCVNDNFVFNVYSRLYIIWFVYMGVVSVLDFMFVMIDGAMYAVSAKVSSGVLMGLVGAAALILYFTAYRRLKKEQDDNRRNFTPPPPPRQGPGGRSDDEIFRGYGL